MNKNQKNKIAIVYDVAYPFVIGGGQRRIYEIAKRLVLKNWDIDWYCLKTWDEPRNVIEVDGIKFIGIMKNINLYTNNSKRSTKEALYYGIATFFRINLDKYDLIWFGQWPYFHILFLYFKNSIFQKPFIIDWWETWNNFWLEYSKIKGYIGRLIEKFIIKNIGYKIVLSKNEISNLLKIGAKSNKIFYMADGVDIELIDSVVKDNDTKYNSDLIYVGRLSKYKQVDHLILATNILKNKLNNIKVVIIGSGPEENKLKKIISELKLENNIFLLNNVDSNEEVIKYLKNSKIFVNPTFKEGGQSITNIEANACGLPLVVYKNDLGIDSEFIKDNYNGFIVNNMTFESLSDKIDFILNMESAEYDKIKISSMNFSKKFDWEIIANDYNDIFQKINQKSI